MTSSAVGSPVCEGRLSSLEDRVEEPNQPQKPAAPGPHDEAELWELVRTTSDPSARDALMDLHLPYARVVAAAYFAQRRNDEVPFDDYLQMASMGLIGAMERFQPDVGVKFRSYAAKCMHGAIMDGVAHATETRQQIAARKHLEAQRQGAIAKVNGSLKSPRSRELVPKQVLEFNTEIGFGFALAWLLDDTGMIYGEKIEVIPFYHRTHREQVREGIIEIVHALPANERHVIVAHYLQEVSFEHLAQAMGLSRGRISQIHRKALERLKEPLANHLKSNSPD